MSKDYYQTLGVEKTATQEEIKKAFRKKAHKFHPDKKDGDETKFKEVNEAYQVIGDETKRKQYDQFGSSFDQQGGFGGGMNWEDFMNATRGQGGGFNMNFNGADFGDIFGDMFGFGGRGGRRQKKGRDIQVDVELTFQETITGIEKEINLTKNNPCAICDGSGAEPDTELKTCSTCSGQGQVTQVQRTILGAMQTRATCPDCQGKGKIPETKCKQCNGGGIENGRVSYTVKIPAGIDNGQSIRLNEKGEAIAGGSPGDLFVVVHVKQDKKFERDGFDIYTEATISYPQAVLGDTVEIETVDGAKKLVIPAGTQSHQQFRLKGLGVPHLRGNGRGSQYVKIIVDIPKKPSRKAKKLLKELQEEV